jgi:hypothetical protein
VQRHGVEERRLAEAAQHDQAPERSPVLTVLATIFDSHDTEDAAVKSFS